MSLLVKSSLSKKTYALRVRPVYLGFKILPALTETIIIARNATLLSVHKQIQLIFMDRPHTRFIDWTQEGEDERHLHEWHIMTASASPWRLNGMQLSDETMISEIALRLELGAALWYTYDLGECNFFKITLDRLAQKKLNDAAPFKTN